MITASSLARLRACPSSAVLARAEVHNIWADAGHDEHEILSRLDELPAELARHVPVGARAEVKVAYDVSTREGRIIGEGGGRDYGTPAPFEIVGSADVIGAADGVAIVLDWKTGFADVEPAATNSQLWFYALAACRALGCSSAIVRIVYTKTGRVDEHTIEPLDLAEFGDALELIHPRIAAAQAARSRGEVLDTREGSWCKHCPSKHVCPSKNALLVQFGERGLADAGDAMMTPQRARAAYEQVASIEQLVKDARKRLETYVDENGPIDLGNGKLYGRYARKGNEEIDGAIALRVIAEMVSPEHIATFTSAAIELSTSKAALKRGADAVGSGRMAAKLVDGIVKKVRELGGSRSKSTRPIGEFAADKHEPALRADIDIDALDQLMAVAK